MMVTQAKWNSQDKVSGRTCRKSATFLPSGAKKGSPLLNAQDPQAPDLQYSHPLLSSNFPTS